MHSPALLLLLALSLTPCLTLRAQDPGAVTPPATTEKAPLTPAQIDELLAPVALYPDALIAIILPASSFPTDVVLAARYLASRQDAEGIESQPWDDSVKALARYPEVVKWMDENLAWTQQLGEAFVLQPAAVLNGTQRLRAAAIAAGNLKSTPQQNVVVEREVIRIEPAEREIIYVPVYDPVVVYRPQPVVVYQPETIVTFSSGYRTGLWLSYSCDWQRNTVVYISQPYRQTLWHNNPSWVYPSRYYSNYHRDWCPRTTTVVSVQRDRDRRHDDRIVRPTNNTYVQHRPDRDQSPRTPDRVTDNREPGRGRRDPVAPATNTNPGQITAATTTNPRVLTQTSPARPNRDTPRTPSSEALDRNPQLQNQRDGVTVFGATNPARSAPATPVMGPTAPSAGINTAATPSRQLTSNSELTSSQRRQPPEANNTRWNTPVVVTAPAPVPAPAAQAALESRPDRTPKTSLKSAPAYAQENRRDSRIDRGTQGVQPTPGTQITYAPAPSSPAPQAAPDSRPDRTPKTSLKSAPAYAQENRREVRAERKAQEAQQAPAAQVTIAPAAPSANTGTVVADDAQTRRRDRRER